MTRSAIVDGHVLVDKHIPPFTNGTIHVRLEAISAADAKARLVAESTIAEVSHGTDATQIPFNVALHGINEAIEYRVRVWLDRESRGHEAAGDVHSDVAYPVVTRGWGTTVQVRL